MIAHSFNPSSQKAEVCGSPQVQNHHELCNEFKARLVYVVEVRDGWGRLGERGKEGEKG